MAWDFSNGLLGMGGFGMGGNNMPANSLLGDFYNPADMRKYQMKQMLLGLGAGLMAEKGMGKGAALALAAGDRAGTVYRDNAMDAYKIKTAQDERAYDRKWQQDERAYRRGLDAEERKRQAKIDAQNNTVFGWRMDEQQRAEDQRNALQNEVTGWMGDQTQQGATLPFSPGVRSIARQGGLAGPSATDQWRFDNAQPYAGAQDYSGAFQQITAKPEPQKAPTVQTFYEDGMEVKKQWDDNTGSWVTVGGAKAPSGGISIDKDGNVTIGGPGGKLTEGDKRARLLGKQVATQEPVILKTFDALSDPQNLAGTTVPGGRYIMSGNGKAAYDAISNIVGNWLYLTSGATATDDEVRKRTNEILPTFGDDEYVTALKKARLQSMIDGMKEAAGISGAAAPAEDGTVVDGFTIRKVTK